MERTYRIVHWTHNTKPQEIVKNTKKEARSTAYWFAVYQKRAVEVYETITNNTGDTVEERILQYWHDEHGLQSTK